MKERTEVPDTDLVDLRDVSLAELRALRTDDDSPFAHCLRRLVTELDDPDALAMVAFQSTV
jgi:hypothetical protein